MTFYGSMCDPWEWYVSLWAYGCDKKGHIYNRVTKAQGPIRALEWRRHPLRAARAVLPNLLRRPDDWVRCYSDVNSPDAFRRWLHMIHDDHHWNDFGEGYGNSPISRFAGLLTYRYLTLFCRQRSALQKLTNFTQLACYDRDNCYIDYFIRSETLETDLFEALDQCGVRINGLRKSELCRLERSNASSRKRSASYYYDVDTSALIHEREKLIVDRFGYAPPNLQAPQEL